MPKSNRKSGGPSGVVEKLKILREFVSGTGSYSEDQLTDCLQQCAYNVERAAERLITGQYVSSKAVKINFTAINSSPQKVKPKKPVFQPKLTVATNQKRSLHPVCAEVKHLLAPSLNVVDDLTTDSYLLCQRWLSDAICVSKNARIAHQERLEYAWNTQGRPVVRFRGRHIEGHLPENVSQMLAPILRHETPLLKLQGESLIMNERVAIGAQVPISLSIFIIEPRAFFDLFRGESAETKAAMYFDSKEKAKKKRLPVAEAAFALLQWAEYGDILPFESPEHEEPDFEDIQLKENDFESADDDSTAQGKMLDDTIGNTDWASGLPETEEPPGLKHGITLRSYQRQALSWMMKREQEGDSREELEFQLQLLAELSSRQQRFVPAFTTEAYISCDCGPVRLSDQAKKRSKTLDGQIDPVSHPLWQRRFLALPGMKESISFYVNELLRVATHSAPTPPRPCSGGILADAMGLGKTVQALALILKSKQLRESEEKSDPSTTLIVAKLSLLPQWEEEIKTKTNLTYRVYYQSSARNLTVEELQGVDIALTTYGTIQGELQRKNPLLLKMSWLRVILDEAHCIRNTNTLASRACCSLKALHRWCVSGTIIQNSLDDVYGLMKFLKHEPWCVAGFWKVAISKQLNISIDADNERKQEFQDVALDRIRRLLVPLMLRRTKDSLTKDGQPILTLPPIESKIIKVKLTENEREFYNALLARSLQLFDGFIEDGTAAKSYLQILSLLQRLRQTCDHIALTVKSRFRGNDGSDCPDAEIEVEPGSPVKLPAHQDVLGNSFMDSLLKKIASKQSPRKDKRVCDNYDGNAEVSAKRPKADQTYVSQVAVSLADAVKENSSHIQDECPICLESPKLENAVITPCAHIFCRDCLLGFLREKAFEPDQNKRSLASLQCPDGPCPCCNEAIQAKRIIALSKSRTNGEITTTYLTQSNQSNVAIRPHVFETQEGNPHAVARQILKSAVRGDESSKMIAIRKELESIWELDPCSKVLIFSQYLGFLDLLETVLRTHGIPFLRLDGGTSLKDRTSILDEFRSNKGLVSKSSNIGTVLLMSMSAGAEGLNLVAASSVFVVDPWWNSAREEQCIHRIHRIGQTAPLVRVRRFVVSDSVEERIVELATRKASVAAGAMGATDGAVGESAKLRLEEFKILFQK